jgi:hypothetical protein
MTSVIGNKSVTPNTHPLTNTLLNFVSTPVGWRVYMGIHCRLREIMYNHIYISEAFDKEYIMHEILTSYIPILEREYTNYEKGKGRAVLPSAFTQEVKQETARMILAWLLAECAEIYKQSRLNSKFGNKARNWL